MNTYKIETLRNSAQEPTWIITDTFSETAEYPEDILDKYEYPGDVRRTTYSDGAVESTWTYTDEDYNLSRVSMIAYQQN